MRSQVRALHTLLATRKERISSGLGTESLEVDKGVWRLFHQPSRLRSSGTPGLSLAYEKRWIARASSLLLASLMWKDFMRRPTLSTGNDWDVRSEERRLGNECVC